MENVKYDNVKNGTYLKVKAEELIAELGKEKAVDCCNKQIVMIKHFGIELGFNTVRGWEEVLREVNEA